MHILYRILEFSTMQIVSQTKLYVFRMKVVSN